MLRALALAAMVLVLVPVRGFPILDRQLVPGELWPGEDSPWLVGNGLVESQHIVEYQQTSLAAMKKYLYKATLHMILEQSTLQKDSKSYKKFRTNLETPRKNAERNHQKTNRLKLILLYQRNLYLITDESTTVKVLGMHLGPSKLIFTGKKELTKVSKNILEDGKLDVFAMKMIVFHDVKKKSENKNVGQLKSIYFKNSYKYKGIWLPLAITPQILQTKTMLKAEEVHLKKHQEDLGSVLVLRTVKQQQSRKHTVIRMMTKKKCKDNSNRVLVSAKERIFFRENANAYSKDQYKMFMEVKQILNDGRKGRHNGFKKYDQLSLSFQQKLNFLVRKKMKVQKCKTTKKCVPNKFPLIHTFTQHRCNYNTQKIVLAYKTILAHIKKTQHPTFKKKMRKKKTMRKKQSMVLRAIREIKREVEIENSSELDYINNNFLAIISDKRLKDEVFISEMNQMKSSICTVEFLKHLIQPFQMVNRYFSVARKGFRTSALKALVGKKHLGTESLLSMSHLRKYICQGPSVVERTKRSTKGENVQISVAFLKHLTSALVVSATIFGMALSLLSLAACYLYYKRRQLKPFLDVVLKGGESLHRSKSSDPNCCTPISLSQAFHFGQSQESRKNQTAMATDSKTFPREQKRTYTVDNPCKIKRTTETCSKEGPDVTVKELYASSDADRSSNGSQRSFTVRSKAYLFPSWSNESMGSLCDDDVCDASSTQHSSSEEIIMEHEFSNQPRSNTNQKEKTPVSVVCHSCKNQGQSTSSDVLLPVKELRISRSKSENDIHVSTSNQWHPVR
ncbi:uncharacterized protein LOC132566611 [Heteronotia binoei]|uniref:uncharacterized protein LOC132566611 n=1 Tax=Heteronotia binoei TaxID=13085 RepID=UPI00292DAE30|nr:uncharacterized protein LOC132566611 [Heteronotia binoei]